MKRSTARRLTLPLLALTIAASAVFVRHLPLLQETPFAWTRAWQTPSAVAVAADGSMAVVENSKRMVSVTDPQGRLRACIRGGSYDTDSFYYAEHVATDGESVVIAEVRHAQNSTFVLGERLLRYDMDGNRLEVLYAVEYERQEQPRQLGRIRSVKLGHGRISFAWANGMTAGASVCENGAARELFAVTLTGDDVLRAAFEPATGTLGFTTKKGGLGMAQDGGSIRWLAYGDGQRVPWSVDVTPGGQLLVSELVGGSVEAVTGETVTPLWQGGLVYELSAAEGGVAFTDGAAVYTPGAEDGAPVASASLALSPWYALQLTLTWLSAAYLLIVTLWLLWGLFGVLRARPATEARRRMLIVAASVLGTAVVLMAFLFSFLQGQMQRQSLANLSRLAESISATSAETVGPRLSRITSLSDYRGEDYGAVRAYLDAFCDASYRNGDNLYYILYRFDDTTLWGVMDYENTTGTRYPYCPLEGTLYGEVIATGRSVQVEGEANIYGMWSYAVAPIYGETGETVGLVEIGANQYGEVVARRTLIREALLGVLVALMMAMLLANEITAFRDERARLRAQRARGDAGVALGFVRPVLFLVFLADNMDAAFLPQLSAALGTRWAGFLGEGLASALPMAAQLFMIGVSALLAGRLLDRRRPRAVLAGGFLLQGAGVLMSVAAVLTQSYWALALGKAIGGLGTGVAVVGCNAAAGSAPEAGERQRLIAGLNVGLMTGVVLGSAVGGFAADYLGYPAAYGAAAVCVLLAGAYGWRSLGGVRRFSPETEDGAAACGSVRQFLRDPGVWGFLLCIMLPYMLMMYFKDYLFPLFASGLGKTESVIGSVMLAGGMLAIVLGEAAPGELIPRVGAWNAARLSSLVSLYALGLFALKPAFETAAVAICLLGVSASFGYAAQGAYYTELFQRAGVGAGKAMGVFSLFDNLGQTGGPLALSALLFLGAAAESGVIAVGALTLLAGTSLLKAGRKRFARHEG